MIESSFEELYEGQPLFSRFLSVASSPRIHLQGALGQAALRGMKGRVR